MAYNLEKQRKRHHAMIAREMEERKQFMDELKKIRSQSSRNMYKDLKTSVGPKWYQVLSVNQRRALDTLKNCIYQDLLEGEPIRTLKVLRILGIISLNFSPGELYSCMYMGHDDPKQVLAHIYSEMFDHDIKAKLDSYDVNGRILLSSIYYLGLNSLIKFLENTFKADMSDKPASPKLKLKRKERKPKAISPYLEKMEPVFYKPAYPKRRPPDPLPNLDHLNEYEEEPTPPPLPPPPPPLPMIPKNRSRTHCDKLAEVFNFQVPPEDKGISKIIKPKPRKLRGSKFLPSEHKKKTYGLKALLAKTVRQQTPVAPSTGLPGFQFMINGVYFYGKKTFYILGGVTALTTSGNTVIGGHGLINGNYIIINNGFRIQPPSIDTHHCCCLEKWNDTVFRYVNQNKCQCRHYYDYGHEGIFPPDEPPFFKKATRETPFQFNYDTIYELEPRLIHAQKEIKKVWDTDSLLHVDDPDVQKKDTKKKKKKEVARNTSTTCLGNAPKVEDYLHCALQFQRHTNLAAQLPDIHLTPELKEWMRRRIYGDYTNIQKEKMMKKCIMYWNRISSLQKKDLYKNWPDKYTTSSLCTTWKYKPQLQRVFKKFVQAYKLESSKAQADFNNMFWATMFESKLPDRRLREIFFCYFVSQVSEIHLINPYSSVETQERKFNIREKRRICLTKGRDDLNVI